jgi:hypothetical protein
MIKRWKKTVELDDRVVAAIRRFPDGTVSFGVIRDTLGVSKGALRHALLRLIKDGRLTFKSTPGEGVRIYRVAA